MRRFRTRWVTLKDAAGFIARHHRHHAPPQGAIVALGLFEGQELVGVGVLGRPVNRVLQAEGVVECTRLCVREDLEGVGGHASCAASHLLARLRRVAQALGFARMVSYTLETESGSAWAGAGAQRDLVLGGGAWTTPARVRQDANFPTARKIRWWLALKEQAEIEL